MRAAVAAGAFGPSALSAFEYSLCEQIRRKADAIETLLAGGLSDEDKRIQLDSLRELREPLALCDMFAQWAYETAQASSSVLVELQREDLSQAGRSAADLGPGTSIAAASGVNPDDRSVDRLYVLDLLSSSVWFIDPQAGVVVDRVGVAPPGSLLTEADLAVTPDGLTVVAALPGETAEVVFIDAAQRRIAGRLSAPEMFPTSLALSPDGSTLFVAAVHGESAFSATRGSVQIVDMETRQAVDEIDLGPAATVDELADLAVSPDGGLVYVLLNRGGGGVLFCDVRSRTVSTLARTAFGTTRLAVHRDGSRLYVFPDRDLAAGAHGVGVIDVATAVRSRVIDLPTPPAGRAADMLLSPASDVVSVSSNETTVVYHLSTLSETVLGQSEVAPGTTRLYSYRARTEQA